MSTPDPTQASGFREAHLRDYWKIIWQGRWTTLAIFVVVVGVVAIWTFLQTPIYRATATVEVQPQARRLMSGQDGSGMGASGFGWFAQEKYHNTQVEIIKSRDVSQRVVRMLGLESHPSFEGSSDPVDALRRSISVDPRRDTGLIEISITGPDKDAITQWVNAVAQAYTARNFEKAQQNVTKAVETIEDQMDKLQRQLSDAEEVRIDALEDTQIFDSVNQEEIVRQRLKTYNAELTELQLELSQLADSLNQIRSLRQAGEDLLGMPELREDSGFLELEGRRTQLQQDLESASVQFRPKHAEYEKIAKELARVEKSLEDKLKLYVGGLANRYELLAGQERHLKSEISRAERASIEVAKAASRYDIVKTDADTKKRIFDLISKTLNEVALSGELMNNNVDILDDATVPRYPIKPRKKVSLMIGAMFGMFLGVGAVFFLDYLDNTIRTPDDVEKYLSLSVLGVVPKMDSEGMAGRAAKEAYQSLRTSIIFSSKNRQRKVILVTSTGPREGKSSTIANVGRILAAAGDRVILIDCDLRRPKQHLHHKLERDTGLTNFLSAPKDETDWSIFTKKTETPNLTLFTSGPIPPSPPDLLGGERFHDLLRQLRERYDWILIDSPPAATLADASLLASLADMIVMVVKHNATDRDMVIKTVQQIRSVNADIAGVVLNQVDLERAHNKDYYYAGYYYEEDDTSKRKKRVEKNANVG